MRKSIFCIILFFCIQTFLFTRPFSIDEFVSKNLDSYLIKEISDKDINEYKEFYDTYLNAEDFIINDNYEAANEAIDRYIKKHKNIFNSRNFIDDYMKYGYVFYLLFLKALIVYEKGSMESAEMIYLSYYILDKYKFPGSHDDLLFYKSSIQTLAFKCFEALLKFNSYKDIIENIINHEGAIGFFLYLKYENVNSREIYLKSKNSKYPEKRYYFLLLLGEKFEINLSEKEKKEYDFGNLSAYKRIKDALLLYIVDRKTGGKFREKLENKARINVSVTYDMSDYKWLLDEKYYTLFLIRNDKLGQKLLKKYVLSL